MSPLSVVVAAIFWGWIWGPVGLGRLDADHAVPRRRRAPRAKRARLRQHPARRFARAHAAAALLPARALRRVRTRSSNRRATFLKRRSLAAYCDTVAHARPCAWPVPISSGKTLTDEQLHRGAPHCRGRGGHLRHRRRPQGCGAGTRRNFGARRPQPRARRHLRHLRELESGQWQGPLDAAEGSVVICVGLGSVGDDLMTEILVRVLRDLQIDARHLSVADLSEEVPEGAVMTSVSMVCVVSVSPTADLERGAGGGRAECVSGFRACVHRRALLFGADVLNGEPGGGRSQRSIGSRIRSRRRRSWRFLG